MRRGARLHADRRVRILEDVPEALIDLTVVEGVRVRRLRRRRERCLRAARGRDRVEVPAGVSERGEHDRVPVPGRPVLGAARCRRQLRQLLAVRVHDVEVVVLRPVVAHEGDVAAVRRELGLRIHARARERHLLQPVAVERACVDRPEVRVPGVARERDLLAGRGHGRRQCVHRTCRHLEAKAAVGRDEVCVARAAEGAVLIDDEVVVRPLRAVVALRVGREAVKVPAVGVNRVDVPVAGVVEACERDLRAVGDHVGCRLRTSES